MNFSGRVRPSRVQAILFTIAFAVCCLSLNAAETSSNASPYARWKNGPSTNENYFPIAVWLQNPANAARFKSAGINLYVGLYRGPTSDQLAQLRDAGLSVICSQSRGLEHKDNTTIIGWMHGDEPDNAQSLGQGKGYGPPILPEKIVADYQRLRSSDPTRPVLLNLGQGVAWDNYIGRGVRRNHPEDYLEYVKGSDIASFDIYPAVHDNAAVAGKLEFVARGVERLRGWAGEERVTWNCIECTRISNTNTIPTPHQVRAEVWMSLIHGSRGLIYFVHQFKPVFREAALLDNPEMLAAVTAINKEIHELAPVLNSPSITNGIAVHSSMSDAPIAWMLKRHHGATYLFAVNMRDKPTRGTFSVRGLPAAAKIEVLGDERRLNIGEGQWADNFTGYAVHLYRIGN